MKWILRRGQFMDEELWEGKLFPIQILLIAVKIYPQFTKHEIQRELSDLIWFNKQRAICEEQGHNIVRAEAFISPEHGSEHLKCGRCGGWEVINYY